MLTLGQWVRQRQSRRVGRRGRPLQSPIRSSKGNRANAVSGLKGAEPMPGYSRATRSFYLSGRFSLPMGGICSSKPAQLGSQGEQI